MNLIIICSHFMEKRNFSISFISRTIYNSIDSASVLIRKQKIIYVNKLLFIQ